MASCRPICLSDLSSTSCVCKISDRVSESLRCFIRFNIAGISGFLADTGVFTYLCWISVSPDIARCISVIAGTSVNWPMDRSFTFSSSNRKKSDEVLRYFCVAALSQLQNYIIFVCLTHAFPRLPCAVCVIAGAIWTTGFSFFAQMIITFTPVKVDRADCQQSPLYKGQAFSPALS